MSLSLLAQCCRSLDEVKLVRKIGRDSKVEPTPLFLAHAIRALRYKPSEETQREVMKMLEEGEELGFRAGKEEGREDGALVYTAAMDHLIRRKQGLDAASLLERARSAGGEPNAYMYSLAIKGAVSAGDGERARALGEEASSSSHVQLTAVLKAQISELSKQ